jgi:hypothetical protein
MLLDGLVLQQHIRLRTLVRDIKIPEVPRNDLEEHLLFGASGESDVNDLRSLSSRLDGGPAQARSAVIRNAVMETLSRRLDLEGTPNVTWSVWVRAMEGIMREAMVTEKAFLAHRLTDMGIYREGAETLVRIESERAAQDQQVEDTTHRIATFLNQAGAVRHREEIRHQQRDQVVRKRRQSDWAAVLADLCGDRGAWAADIQDTSNASHIELFFM